MDLRESTFNSVPLVKLYTANLNQEKFVYSKIRGALCFVAEEIDKKDQYFLQIYYFLDKQMLSLFPHFCVQAYYAFIHSARSSSENFSIA